MYYGGFGFSDYQSGFDFCFFFGFGYSILLCKSNQLSPDFQKRACALTSIAEEVNWDMLVIKWLVFFYLDHISLVKGPNSMFLNRHLWHTTTVTATTFNLLSLHLMGQTRTFTFLY